MNIATKHMAIGLLLGLLPWAALSTAADDVKRVGASDSRPAPVIDLAFPGGTIKEYTDAVRKAAGPVNIVIATPETGSLPVPQVRLKEVDVCSAVQIVEGDIPQGDATELRVRVQPIKPMVGQPENIVYRIYAERIQLRRETRREVMVWTLTGVLSDEMTAEDVLTAVETAVGLLGPDRQPAEIRFHEATGLLVAAGDPDQLSAIDCVVDRLRETVHIKAEAAGHAGLEAMDKANEGLQWIMEFGAEQEDLKGRLEGIQAHMTELEQRLAQKTHEAEDLRGQHEATTRDRERLLMEMEHLRNQLRDKDNMIAELEKKVSKGERR